LLNLYTTYADRIATSPASGKVHYHSSFIGGYVYHVLNMINCTKKISDLWLSLNGKPTYTEEEMYFACLNHDLGKIGNLDHEYYVQTEEQWKIKRGQVFDFNPKLQYMAIQDRSIFLLQHFGIKMTETEYIGIKIHDGLYDEGNKSYYITYDPHFGLRSMLPHVMHWGDMLATKLEYEEWLHSPEGIRFMNNGGTHTESMNYKKPIKKPKIESMPSNVETFDTLFNNIFPDTSTKEA